MDKISKSAVDKIGEKLRSYTTNEEEYLKAIDDLNNWRKNHGEIMDFYLDECHRIVSNTLKNYIEPFARLKRLVTILDKIINRQPKMRLSSLQDVAGVRVIVNNMNELATIEKEITKLPGFVKCTDYIDSPKSDGYRGKHFIFEKDGMFVEVQLRTYLQHLWATAVETIGAFENIPLKTAGGPRYWEEFFELASSIFAYTENSPLLKQFSGKDIIDLSHQLNDVMVANKINIKLQNYIATRTVLENIKEKGSYFVLISLCKDCENSTIKYYEEKDYDNAVRDYEEVEKDDSTDNVLISANELKQIEKAYPNYFLNIEEFKNAIGTCIKEVEML